LKVTFPYLGPVLAYQKMFELFGHEVIAPLPPNPRTIELGVKHSPEFICFPFKIILGNYIDAIQRGAELIVTSGGIGACRAGYFGALSEKILNQLGYPVKVLVFDSILSDFPSFYRQGQEIRNHKSVVHTLSIMNLAIHLIFALDQYEKKMRELRPYEKVQGTCKRKWREIQNLLSKSNTLRELRVNRFLADKIIDRIEIEPKEEDILKIGLLGEIYMVMDGPMNEEFEDKLASLGVQLVRYRYISQWLKNAVRPDNFLLKKADSYLKYDLGGHERENIGHMIRFKELGYDGIIHLLPFGCMPELVTQTVIPRLMKDLNMPILSLSLDEQTGWLNNQVRLEAFVDLLRNRKELLREENRVYGY
jgi:predicted nucleotide-binding protein (sugar kinase/HSP70/actin superfamily)